MPGETIILFYLHDKVKKECTPTYNLKYFFFTYEHYADFVTLDINLTF